MTASIASAHGIVCGNCSHGFGKGRVIVRHVSVAAVRHCATSRVPAPRVDPFPIVKINSLPPVPAEASRNVTVPTPQVPAGRYAVRGTDGVVRFYVVDHGTVGTRWEGKIFVSVQASDDLHPVRDRAKRIGILAAILIDPKGASALYGRELGRCGVCNRTLTDPDSIAAGIGPVCAGRF